MNTRRLQLILSFAIGIAAAIYCYVLYSAFDARWNYLTWDPATHGWDGMRLALDIKDLNFIKLLEDTNRLVLWPPLHSYLQIPFFLLFNFDFPSSVLCSLVFLTLFFPALAHLYHQIDVSWAGYLVLMGLSATSPMILGYGTMPMLEIFGAVLTAFAASLLLRKSRWFPLSLTLLFFLKYNYCLYLLLPVLVVHSSKSNLLRMSETLRPLRPFLILIGLFCIIALLILITGGFQIGPLSLRGVGNPAYIIFLTALIGVLWKRQHIVLWNKIKGTGWEWFVIPVLIWLLIPVPNRVKTILSFAINQPIGSPPPTSMDYYLYYFRKLPLYFAEDWIAWFSLPVLIAAMILNRKKQEILIVGFLFVLPFLLMTINQNKQERFLFTFVPALWILVAYMVSKMSSQILKISLALALCGIAAFALDLNFVRETIRWQFAPLHVRAPLNSIAQKIGEAKEVRVLGTTNHLNPASIQYHSGLSTGFRVHQHFDWEIEKTPATDLDIICINCEAPGKLLRSRTFQDATIIRHYLLTQRHRGTE